MSDLDTDAPLDSPPTNFDHITYESLDPPKQDEPAPFESGREGLEQAAEEFSHQTKAERNVVTERTWGDPRDWSKHAPGNRSVSAEHASDMLKEAREAEAALAQAELDEATARAVDDFRDQQPTQPQQPEQQPQELAPQAEVPPAEPTELDRMLAELPEHRRAPFVAAFMEHMDRAAHQARTGYDQAVAQANAVAQQYQQAAIETVRVAESVARAPFAELHSVPNEQLPAVMAHIQRTQPARFAEIQNHVASVRNMVGQQLTAVQQAEHQQTQVQQQRQAAAQQEAAERFQRYGAAEDAKVDKLLAAEPPERRTAIQQEAAAILHEEGLSDQDIAHLWQNDATFRSATSQKLLMKEAKARIAERGVRAARVTPVPHVVRPGTSSESRGDYSQFAEVSREMRGRDLSVKDATRLLLARRASR